MARDELRRLLRAQPFKPFRIHLTDGRNLDVVGPEWMLVTRTTSYVGTPGLSGDGELLAWIENDHITHIETFDAGHVR
jgi:hypothetical protein